MIQLALQRPCGLRRISLQRFKHGGKIHIAVHKSQMLVAPAAVLVQMHITDATVQLSDPFRDRQQAVAVGMPYIQIDLKTVALQPVNGSKEGIRVLFQQILHADT